MKLQAATSLTNVGSFEDFKRWVTQALVEIAQVVNGQLELGPNVKAAIVEVVFTAANTQLSVDHGLGRVPAGYFLAGSSAAMALYDGTQVADERKLYLRSSATGTARIWVF